MNGKASFLPRPVYPPAARAVRTSGAVHVEVLISEEGNIIAAYAVSGHPLLRMAAVDAAKQARFVPVTFEGERVKVSGIIIYNFVPGSPENTILSIGYDLVTAQLLRSNQLHVIEGNLPESWTEEKALIESFKDLYGPEDIVRLQTMIEQRLAANQPALWYLKYGQALGRLRSEIDDGARIAAGIVELEHLAAAVPETFSSKVLSDLKAIQEKAEAARADQEEKAKLPDMLDAIRNEHKIN